MPLEPFNTSEPLTMGVELELQLISLSDYDSTASSPDLLHLLMDASRSRATSRLRSPRA